MGRNSKGDRIHARAHRASFGENGQSGNYFREGGTQASKNGFPGGGNKSIRQIFRKSFNRMDQRRSEDLFSFIGVFQK